MSSMYVVIMLSINIIIAHIILQEMLTSNIISVYIYTLYDMCYICYDIIASYIQRTYA